MAGQEEGGTLIREPAFTTYGMEDGLSQGSVEALVQDRAGFLWIGTHDGLNRFDGTTFRVYRHRRDDPTSLSDDFIHALAEADDGRLWVGTERGGLNLFEPGTGRVERYELFEMGPWRSYVGTQDDPGENRIGRTVRGIVVRRDGTLLLHSDVGLLHFDPASGSASMLDGSPEPPARASPTAVCALPEGGGALVGFADGRVARVEDVGVALAPVLRLPAPVSSFHCRGDGSVHGATETGEVYALDLEGGGAERILEVRSPAGDRLTVRDVQPQGGRWLWLATREGLYVAPSDGTDLFRVGQSQESRALPDSDVQHLLLDATGVLWIGTWNGLASLHPLSATMRRVFNGTGGEPGLAGNGVIAFASGGDPDHMWVGTNSGGVQFLTFGPDGTPTVSRPAAVASLAEAFIFDLTRGPEGELWIAAFTDGVFRLEPGGRRLERIPVLAPDGEVIPGRIYSVFVDASSDVWAGSRTHGLLRYDPISGGFVPFSGPGWNLGSAWVWPIAEDDSGRLWIGALNGGLSSIAPEGRVQRRYPAGPEGLSDDRILTVFVDSRGHVWIGTEGGGLNCFDPVAQEFTLYTTADGLPHDHVEGIIEDDLGYLWITTNDGVARFDPDAGTLRIFKQAAGLAGNRFYANAVFKNERGEIFLGGPDGLTILDPAKIGSRIAPPRVTLTFFEIHGREEPMARALAPAGLELAPDENFFTFGFAALDFTDVTQHRYRYRLEGLDDGWIEAGSERVAHYTSVPPGSYTFKVAARTGEGSWVDDALAIPIHVQAPYYQTLWFRAAVVAAALLLVSGFYSYRLSELRRRQDLRLRIAGRLHDDIGANLSAVALKVDMLRGVPKLDAVTRSRLDDVGRLARETIHKVRETVWVVNTRYDTVAGLVAKMRDTADLMLEGQVGYRFVEPDRLPDRRIGMELRQNVHLLFKEALHNAVKHSGAGTVEIEIGYDAPELWFRVKDDGTGFDPEAAVEGSGLELMRHHASSHDGRLVVSSRPGEGTTVGLRVAMR